MQLFTGLPVIIAATAALATTTLAAPAGDEVTSLPGWEGALPSKQYSGFLTSSSNHLHYIFVESSGTAPEKAPVVLWLNGGPGASSFGYGYLTELGPFSVATDNATALDGGVMPKLVANPTAWTTVANVLFLETPSPVGFSYCEDPSSKKPNPSCQWTDTTTAALNFAAVTEFFKLFPEYKANPFHIWGESYGGIYVPTLAELILNASTAADVTTATTATTATTLPKLAGIGVGNGCVGDKVGACSNQGVKIDVDFLYGHGAISQPTYAALYAECPDFTNPNNVCNEWLDKMSAEAGEYYAYNLYDDCGPNGQTSRHQHYTWREHQHHKDNQPHKQNSNSSTTKQAQQLSDGDAHANHQFGYPCGKQHGAAAWLNTPSVRKALNVPLEAFYGMPYTLLSPNLDYTSNIDSLFDTYTRIIPQTKVLVYNGDLDPCVPYNGNEEWTRGLGLTETAGWAPWFSDPGTGSQIAGYQTVYEHNFTFATVKGAGHMVPQYQPQRALDLFSRWIGVADAPALPIITAADDATKESKHKHNASSSSSSFSSPPPKRNPIGSSREADKVESLPGWAGPLPSAQYSGYLDVPLKTGGKKDIHIHYWLSESENDPSTDPVVFWMNGGPGGSSLIGGLTENGPFYLDDSSFGTDDYKETGVPTLHKREWTWAHMANMVYVETPAMTGFSYCDNNECAWNDSSTADAHYQMTLAMIDAFPQFKDRDLYFTGESYAGLYIPMVSDRILNNTVEAKAHGVNLKGFMIGNGCPGWDVLTCTPYSCGHTGGICAGGGTDVAVDFRFGHGLASQPTYAEFVAACGQQHWDDPSPACINAINKFTDETSTGGLAGSTYNIYDMCGNDDTVVNGGSTKLTATAAGSRKDGAAGVYAALNDRKLAQTVAPTPTTLPEGETPLQDLNNNDGGLNNYPCGEAAGMTAWLNVPAVQKALHVTVAHRSDGQWAPSTGLNYTHTSPTLLHMYPRLIEKLRILLFSGDVDECVPYNGAEEWTRGFGYEEQEHWRPWVVGSSVAGYTTVYQTPHNFTWATVRGAGHMAPLFQPTRVYNLFERFVHQKKI